MTISILFITHSGIGLSMMATLNSTFGDNIIPMQELSIGKMPDPEALATQALDLVHELDTGQGVLVFTDMIGSTPCNIAQRLVASSSNVRVITGVNLPMMFRVFNYPNLPIDVLAKKAVNAGKEGILEPVKESRMVVVSKSERLSGLKEQEPYDKKASSDRQ